MIDSKQNRLFRQIPLPFCCKCKKLVDKFSIEYVMQNDSDTFIFSCHGETEYKKINAIEFRDIPYDSIFDRPNCFIGNEIGVHNDT